MNHLIMTKRTQIFSIFFIFGMILSTSLIAQGLDQAPRFEPYMPGELNERALYALQKQDHATAIILLERAYRLNPNSPDIKANLEIVRQIVEQEKPVQVVGKVIQLDAAGNPIQEDVPINISPLWPEPK